MVGDGEALMHDEVGRSPWGDAVARLGQKEGCGSPPEVSKNRQRMPLAGHAEKGGDGAPHGHGSACGEVGMHPRRTSRAHGDGGIPREDGGVRWDRDEGRACRHSASGRWGCLRGRHRI